MKVETKYNIVMSVFTIILIFFLYIFMAWS